MLRHLPERAVGADAACGAQSFKTLKLSDTDTYFAVTEEVLNKVLSSSHLASDLSQHLRVRGAALC